MDPILNTLVPLFYNFEKQNTNYLYKNVILAQDLFHKNFKQSVFHSFLVVILYQFSLV